MSPTMVGRRENFLTLEALKTPCRDFKSDIFGLKIGSKKFFALPRETLKYHLYPKSVSYTHLRAHETEADLVCRLLLEKKN